MLSRTTSNLVGSVSSVLKTGQYTLSRYILIMASALTALLAQTRGSRSESHSKSPLTAIKESEVLPDSRLYPGSLHRHKGSIPSVNTYRSISDVSSAPSLRPITVPIEEPVEDWVAEKLSQASQRHTSASNDWTDILSFYTATNGSAPAAPTRASPAPISNGKSSSSDVPTSVTSSDPKIAAQQANDMRNIVRRKLTGYVGFANLPNQWHRKSVRKGFNFNVMVVGGFDISCLVLSDMLTIL